MDNLRSRPQANQHAGLGGLPRVGEHGILGQRDVNTRLLDVGDGHHGSFQFAFERAPVVHMLGEIGDAEIRFVEDLESDASGFGQSQAGHFQAQLRDFVLRRQQLGSVVGDFVIDAAFMQLLHNGVGVFRRQSGIEGLQSAFALPARKAHHARHHRHRHDSNGRIVDAL